MAEIIQHYRKTEEKLEKTEAENEEITINNEDYYMNPVCNIPIQKSTAKHVLEYEGEKVYFCCDGCKVSFEKDPTIYIK